MLALQVATLFEVCGRESDIGFDDDSQVFMQYHATSCEAFSAYAAGRLDGTAAAIAREALNRMYMEPQTERYVRTSR